MHSITELTIRYAQLNIGLEIGHSRRLEESTSATLVADRWLGRGVPVEVKPCEEE